jgi:hypothetical protein
MHKIKQKDNIQAKSYETVGSDCKLLQRHPPHFELSVHVHSRSLLGEPFAKEGTVALSTFISLLKVLIGEYRQTGCLYSP